MTNIAVTFPTGTLVTVGGYPGFWHVAQTPHQDGFLHLAPADERATEYMRQAFTVSLIVQAAVCAVATDSDLVTRWAALLPMSSRDLIDGFADGQVQLGYGRVEPTTLSREQWRRIGRYVAYTLACEADSRDAS